MTPLQLGIIYGARITLLVGAFGIFVWGALLGGSAGTVLIGVGIVVLVLYVVIQSRTRSMIRAALIPSRDDQGTTER